MVLPLDGFVLCLCVHSARIFVFVTGPQILAVTAHAAGTETTKAIADMRFMLNAGGRAGVVGDERAAVQDAITKLESKRVCVCVCVRIRVGPEHSNIVCLRQFAL